MRTTETGEIESKFDGTQDVNVRVPQTTSNTSMEKLEKEFIPKAYRLSEELADKEIVLLIGATGSGKSTLTHYLMGHPLTLHEDSNTLALSVKPKRVEDEKKGPKIGEDNIDSCTLYAQAYPSKNLKKKNHLWLCDCPGYNDNRGLAEACCALISSQLAVRRSSCIKSIVVVVPWNAVSGEGGSKSTLKELVRTLSEMFGVNSLDILGSPSVFFAITHLPERFSKKETEALRTACTNILERHILKITPKSIVTSDALEELQVLKILRARMDQFIFPRVTDQGVSCDVILKQLQAAKPIQDFSLRVPETASAHFSRFMQALKNYASVDKAQMWLDGIKIFRNQRGELQSELQQAEEKIQEIQQSIQRYQDKSRSTEDEAKEASQHDAAEIKQCQDRIKEYELKIEQYGLSSNTYRELEREQRNLISAPPSAYRIISVTRGTTTGRVLAIIGRVAGWSPIYGGIGGWMNALVWYKKEIEGDVKVPFIRIDTELPSTGHFEIKECDKERGSFKGVYSVQSDGLGKEAKLKVIVLAKVKNRERLKVIQRRFEDLREQIQTYTHKKAVEQQKIDSLKESIIKRREQVSKGIWDGKLETVTLKHRLERLVEERKEKQQKLNTLMSELQENQKSLANLRQPIKILRTVNEVFELSDSMINGFLEEYKEYQADLKEKEIHEGNNAFSFFRNADSNDQNTEKHQKKEVSASASKNFN